MSDIPDEAVERAYEVITDYSHIDRDAVRDALEAALPYIDTPQAVTITENVAFQARIRELEDAVRDMECTCLPYAKPHDGMCRRCMALRTR